MNKKHSLNKAFIDLDSILKIIATKYFIYNEGCYVEVDKRNFAKIIINLSLTNKLEFSLTSNGILMLDGILE